jgi:hypothetical protein
VAVTRHRLSDSYQQQYAGLIAEVADMRPRRPVAQALFWPKVGRHYDGGLMLVGRAVNGWIDRWEPGDGRDPGELAAGARRTAEGMVIGCPMGWVLDRWGKRDGGYNTARSQFWDTVRRVAVSLHPEWSADWPSHLVWSNLAKVAPYDGGNPGSASLRLQRGLAGAALLAREVAELAPRRILALTGRWWFAPFADALGGDLGQREGLVEAAELRGEQHIVVAVHPMTRSPEAVSDAIISAFVSLEG